MGVAFSISEPKQELARIGDMRAAVALFLPEFRGSDMERLCVAHLDRDLRLLAMNATQGSSHRTVRVPIRPLMRDAMRLGTRGMIIAHNHPGGDPNPSEADKDATRMLASAAKALGITLLDHLIVANGQVVSLRELGLL